MAIETDVLVVGGGATGVGVARDLALRGVDTVLVERDGLAGGTSGRSHGLLHSGARYAESDPEGAMACVAENEIVRDIGGECVRDTGGLFVHLADDDPDYFAEKRDACEAVGIETETVPGERARELVPDLAPSTARALRVPDAVVYPSRLVAANAADARAHGARIYTHAPVQTVAVADGRVDAVRVGGSARGTRVEDEGERTDERIEPAFVVNATGAWAGEFASMAGASVDMQPTRGVMVSVEYAGLGPVLNRCRAPDDGDIVVPHEREAVLGTTSVPVDDPDEHPREDWEVERTVAECAAMLPPVRDAAVARTWWGVRPLYAPDEVDRERGISRDFVLLDHAADDVSNLATVVGGKLTTYREMAEATADLACEHLGVDADCATAERSLPGADDAERLDEFVVEFDAGGPADADVVGGE